jgi:hypothetical protein
MFLYLGAIFPKTMLNYLGNEDNHIYKLWYLSAFLLSFGAKAPSKPGLNIQGISRSHTMTQQSVGLLWTSD